MRLSLLGAALTFASVAMGQDAIEKIARTTCDCITDEMLALPTEERNNQLGICILTASVPFEKELKRKMGVDMERIDEHGEELGRLVGIRMVRFCPDKLLVFANDPKPKAAEEDANRGSVRGTLQEVRKGTFLTAVLLDSEGRKHEILFLGQVPNGELLLAREAKGLEADWEYRQEEFYDPASGGYRMFRVLAGIRPRG